jgi:NTE family protein
MRSDQTRLLPVLCRAGCGGIAFHLGCLRALKRLGLLDHVAVLSIVSGGSVIGAYFHANCDDFPSFEAEIRRLLARGLVAPMRRKLFSALGIKVAAAFIAVGLVALAVASIKAAVRFVSLVTP